MKTIIIKNLLPAPWAWLGLILFFVLGVAKAQTQTGHKPIHKKYIASLVLTSGALANGRINSIADSSIQLAGGQSFHFSSIRTIKIKKHKAVLTGAAVGATAGLVIGSLAAKHEDFECDPNVIICGQIAAELEQAQANFLKATLGALLGAGLGAVIGAASIKQFEINGLYSQFEQCKNEMIRKGVQKSAP